MINFNITIKNKKIKRLVNINLLISFITCILGILTLWIYNTYYIWFYLFDASIVIFRTGLFIGIFSIIYGIFFENYLEYK
jgi:hypothetical protein